MQNIQMTRTGDTLTITVNLAAPALLSTTGKTLTVATTHGNKPITGTPCKIGLTIFKHKI